MHITGVEIKPEREPHLRKWCDEVRIGDYIDQIRELVDVGAGQMVRIACMGEPSRFDLGIGNPWFKGLVNKPRSNVEEHVVEAAMPPVLLEHMPAVFLLHTLNAFTRSAEGRSVWRAYPPIATYVLPGTVSFDGTSSVASDCYAASLWLRGYQGDTTRYLVEAEAEDYNRAHGIVDRKGRPYRCWRWGFRIDGNRRIPVPPGSEEPSDE